jgi:hypothetical protein
LPRCHGAGEGAALVPEQLALDQVVADGAAIDDDEGLIFAVALLVNGARQHVFTGAGFTFNQYRGIGGRNALEHTEDAAHGQAGAEHVAEMRRLAG